MIVQVKATVKPAGQSGLASLDCYYTRTETFCSLPRRKLHGLFYAAMSAPSDWVNKRQLYQQVIILLSWQGLTAETGVNVNGLLSYR